MSTTANSVYQAGSQDEPLFKARAPSTPICTLDSNDQAAVAKSEQTWQIHSWGDCSNGAVEPIQEVAV